MLRSLLIGLAAFLAIPGQAHEFWIAPQNMILQSDEPLRPVVKIGTNFEGVEHPFDPRAYRQVVWIAPGQPVQPKSQTGAEFAPLAEGLHILAVESNAQSLSHASASEFQRYIREIGLQDSIDASAPGLFPGGPILERYTRFSKTLVHIGRETGKDIKVGLQYEWVRDANGLRLFHDTAPQRDHPAFLFCRTPGSQDLYMEALRTDADGRVTPTLPQGHNCLLNAVFLSRQGDGSWLSAWTSLLFRTQEMTQ